MKRRAGYALAVWLLFCAACFVVVRHTVFNGDISAFLPGKPSEAQKILVDQLQDGPISRMLLLAIEGGGEADRAAASRALLERLVADPALAYSHNGDETRMGPERDFLLNHRYVLSDAVTPARFTQAALREAMDNNLDMLNSPLGMLVKRVLPEDPTGEFVHLIEQFEGQSRPAQRDGVWFSRDGNRALLVTQTKAPGFDIDAQEIILRDIRAHFASIKEKTGAAQLSLLVTGPGIFAIKTRDAIRGDAERLSIIAVVMIAALLLWFFRSPRVLILSLIPVATGVLAGIAAVSLTFGSVHGITLGFGVTLIGEAVDYAVYLFTQQTKERQSDETLRRIWPTLRLGLFTSVAGFSAMLFSGFPGLGQLGLFSIAGLVAAVVTTRWLLPHFLPPGFSADIAAGLKQTLLAWAAHAPKFRHLVAGLVAIALVTIFLHRHALWNDDLSSLSPMPLADKKLDESVRNDLGAPDVGILLVARGDGQENALQLAERLASTLNPLVESGVLSGFDSPAMYLPSKAAQEARRTALPEAHALRTNLDAALQGMPFQSGLFAPFLSKIDAARGAGILERSGAAGTAFAIKLDGLLTSRGDETRALMPLRGLKDEPKLRAAIAALNEPHVTLIDLKRESDQLYGGYRQQAVRNTLLGTVAISALLLIALRSPARAYRVIAPLAAAVIVTTAILLATGHGLSIFHLVALLLVIGVGSNYALFFDRENFARGTPERTLASLVLCNISTIIGFGALGFSSTPVLAAIGSTVAYGALLSLIFAAALTPGPTPIASAQT